MSSNAEERAGLIKESLYRHPDDDEQAITFAGRLLDLLDGRDRVTFDPRRRPVVGPLPLPVEDEDETDVAEPEPESAAEPSQDANVDLEVNPKPEPDQATAGDGRRRGREKGCTQPTATEPNGKRKGGWSADEVEHLKRLHAEGWGIKAVSEELRRAEISINNKTYNLGLTRLTRDTAAPVAKDSPTTATDAPEEAPQTQQRRCPGCNSTFETESPTQRVCPVCSDPARFREGGAA